MQPETRCHCLESLDRIHTLLRRIPRTPYDPDKPAWAGKTAAEVCRNLLFEMYSQTYTLHLEHRKNERIPQNG